MTAEPIEAPLRIRRAAFRLFGHKGYSCTSIQDIADEAAVKKSILYYYFRSKEELYRALLQESAEHLRVILLQALAREDGKTPNAAPPSTESRLCALAEMLVCLARDNRESVRFFLAHIFAADADRPVWDAEAMGEMPRGLIAEIARDGVTRGELDGDPIDIERLLLGAIQFSIIRFLQRPDQEPLSEGLGRRIVRCALRGFAAAAQAAAPAPAATNETKAEDEDVAATARVRTKKRNAKHGK